MNEMARHREGPPVVLLVGGTDPSGGAGLAADIKSVAAAGAHGEIAVTAVTFQNSGAVEGWEPVPKGSLSRQVEAVLRDGPVQSVKSGMLGGPGIALEMAAILETSLAGVPYVLDPVLAAGSGDALHEGGIVDVVRRRLVPLCALCTPNLDEAEALTGGKVRSRDSMERAACAIVAMGAGAALVKGGHLEGEPADFLLEGGSGRWFEGRRTYPGKLHGTGCTLASGAAARIACGQGIEEAVGGALHYLRQAAASYFERDMGALLGHFPAAGPRSAGRDSTAFYSAPRYCSRCGTQLSAPALQGHPCCPTCGYVHYRNPLPAVTIVAEEKRRVLLVRRAVAPGLGEFCLPGGFLELGETAAECAERELREETGLSAGSMRLRCVETDETEYGGIVLAVFEASEISGDAIPGDDASEVGWFPLDSVPPLAFAAHRRIVSGLSGREIPECLLP